MADLPKRIALVYDSVNKWGGAESVLLALHDLFPAAPLYTSVYDSAGAAWASVFPQVIPSFLQKFPFAKSNREFYPWLTPLAFESFDFRGFDVVISVSSADAKGVLTHPATFHLNYCLTPTRYLWSHHDLYRRQLGQALGLLSRPVFGYLKKWDLVASHRPDAIVSISQTVSDRVKTFYGLDSPVVYPPVNISDFSSPVPPPPGLSDFFLYLGRLVLYKRPDLVIQVFNQLNYPLVVAGTGRAESKLRRLAAPHIHFTGFVTPAQKLSLLQHCRALIFFHEEDFGLVSVEAQAAGRPVIALNRGGAAETVVPGQTGILIDDSSPQALAAAVGSFNPAQFSPELIRSHAQKFSRTRFQAEFVKIFTSQWKKYKNTSSF